MKNYLSLAMLALAGCLASNPEPTAYRLADVVVVVQKSADKKTAADLKRAADDFAGALSAKCGAKIPVFEEGVEPADAKAKIYLGKTAAAAAAGLTGDEMRNGDWCVRNEAGRGFIFAKTPWGLRGGVRDFLTRELDYHVYFQDGHDTFVPDSEATIPTGERTVRPAVYKHHIYHAMYNGNIYPTIKPLWERYSRMNNLNDDTRSIENNYRVSHRTPGCHSQFAYCDPAKYFKDHPEYFCVGPDGKRHGVPNSQSQLCFTNPDTYRICLESLERFVEADRKANPTDYPCIYDFTQLDNSSFLCCCENCKNVIAKYNRVPGGHSEGGDAGLQLEFVNRLARDIRKKYPDVQIRTFAYVSTECAPKPGTITVEPNVVIWWCDVYSHSDHTLPLETPGHFNMKQAEELGDWIRLTKNIEVWDYMLYTDAFPEVSVDAIAADAKLFAKSNIPNVFMESEYHGQPFYELNTYVWSRVYENPGEDVEKLVDEFCRAYGAAAGEMRAAVDLIRGEIKARHATEPADWHNRNIPWLDLATMETLTKLFETAYAKAGKDAVLKGRLIRPLLSVYARMYAILRKEPLQKAKFLKVKDEYRRLAGELAKYALIEPKERGTYLKKFDEKLAVVALRFKELPPELKDVSSDDLICVNYLSQSRYNFKDDTASECGYTQMAKDVKKLPMPCGAYDFQLKEVCGTWKITPETVPADGVYHWVKLGVAKVGPNTGFWYPGSWLNSFSLRPWYILADGLPVNPNWYEWWVSVKATEGEVSIDRLALKRVPPPKGK